MSDPALDAAKARVAEFCYLDEAARVCLREFAAGAAYGAAKERARIKAILECPEAAGRDASARGLAFETTISPTDAKALLETIPGPSVDMDVIVAERGEAALH